MNSKTESCKRVVTCEANEKHICHKARLHVTDFITIFLIQLVLSLPFYTASVYGLTISDVRVTKVTSDSARVEWLTDDIATGKIRYGKTTELGYAQSHDNFLQNHTLNVVNGVESDSTYFFVVESTDVNRSTTVNNNSNNFYTFKTSDISPPPQVTGLRVVSKTSDSVFLSWDGITASDLSHYMVYRNRARLANTTSTTFNDTGLGSAAEVNYKVSAVDSSSNEGPQSDIVVVSTLGIDLLPPVISNIDFLQITDTSTKITWLTDEDATSMVFYGINATDKTKSSEKLEANHSVIVDGLTKGFKYKFAVKSCDESKNCANSSGSFTAGRDLTPPFIDLSIPRFVNRRVIDIIGATEPFSAISLFVNELNVPKRSLSNDEVGSAGKFVFSQIQLQQDNIIKIKAVDKSGNKNEKLFEVSIDTEAPIVQLDEIRSLISTSNLTISGIVNEPVVIKVFMDVSVTNASAPSQVKGLNVTKIGQNSVELQWDESRDKGFSHYVVYRVGYGPIAITKPANFNLFIDALVDSGKTYSYEVSAVNIFGVEGQKSEPVTVTTLKGGATLNINPPIVDVFEDFRKPVTIVNSSNKFNFGLRLSRGDNTYNIKLIFEDRAENSFIVEKSVTLDTKKPEVKIISPGSGAFVFENVANNIDVVGKTEPNARVHLFVDRTPFSKFNASLELSGLPNEIQDLPEAKLDAKCRLNIAGTSLCSTGADFSTTADSEGNFKFENVDLTAGLFFSGGAQIREVPLTEFRDTRLEEGQGAKTTTLVAIATDQTGQRGVATQNVRIGTCWSGNQSWDIIPLTQFQSPTFISTERLREGTETIYFYFNYSYIGRGTSPIITDISIDKACSTRELVDSRFNISCQILQGVPTKHLKLSSNPAENTVSYSAAPISRFPGMNKFLDKDWKNFLRAINKELTFPLKVRIAYKHDTDNDNIPETETQTTCEEVSYSVDNTIIDPRRVLPDWLLFDFVDFLQSSIKTLTQVQEQLDKLVNFVAVGCISSFVLNFILQFYRRWLSFWEEKTYAIKDLTKFGEIVGAFKLQENKENEEHCKTVISEIRRQRGSFRLKYVNDFDLQKCFPAVASAWNGEAKVYSLMRYSCDRIFGHSSPSRWTETKDDDELKRKAETVEGCDVDKSARGQPLKAENCREAAAALSLPYRERFTLDNKCVIVQSGKGKTLYQIGKPVDGDVYEINKLAGPSEVDTDYAIKVDDFNYITHQSRTCQEICGGPRQGNRATLQIKPDKTVEVITDKSGSTVFGECLTVQECRSLNVKDGEKYKYPTTETRKVKEKGVDGIEREVIKPFEVNKEIKYARTWGYTKGCFYEAGEPSSVVSDSSLEQREECCCISVADSKVPPTNYYQYDDYDPIVGGSVHKAKESIGLEGPATAPTRYGEMEWSYRYWKERFEAKGRDERTHNEYNKLRYIEGRDFPACFGLNHVLYENPLGLSFGEPERVLTLDPSKEHIAAFQCVHLAGISNRLQFLKNLMTSLSTCLIQVRTTGRGDSGACKELFTQYLCSAIWQIVRFIVNKGCVINEFGPSSDEQSDTAADYLKAGFKGVYESISDLQSSISQEYGNAKLNEMLGTGEESVARKICLGAFGYDWEINVKNIVDAAYATPFATLVQPITRSREFLTVDPVTFKPKYEYRASWLINPGCDFERYDVYLACVGKKQLDQYPNSVNCGAIGAPSIAYTGALSTSPAFNQCDCLGLPDEKRRLLVSGRRLKQNVLEDTSFHQVIDDNYRYDHLEFVLRPDRRISSTIKPNCFPTGYDDGVFYFPIIDKTSRDIFDCRVDVSGGLICGAGAGAFASGKGTAEFVDILINEQNALTKPEVNANAGDRLKVDVTVRNIGQDKCIVMRFGSEAKAEIINEEGIVQRTLYTEPLTAGKREDVQSSTQNIQVQKITLGNQQEVGLVVKFLDVDKNEYITLGSGQDQIVIGGNSLSMDDIQKAPNSRVTIGSGAEQVDISIEDGKLMLAKQEAKIAIIAVQVQRDRNTGIVNYDKNTNFPFAQGLIRIFKPIDITTTQLTQQQTTNLIIGLYHTRDTLDPNNPNVGSCNINDKVLTAGGAPQERNIKIIVQQKPTLSIQQTPEIKPNKPSQSFKKDDAVGYIPIFATILFKEPITSTQMTCTGPDGKALNSGGILQSNNNYEFDIIKDNLEIAGKYSCDITAKSVSQKESKSQVDFEVQCGDKQNEYGTCDIYGNCFAPNKDAIFGGLKCHKPPEARIEADYTPQPPTET